MGDATGDDEPKFYHEIGSVVDCGVRIMRTVRECTMSYTSAILAGKHGKIR